MDFTLNKYKQLIENFQKKGYVFQTFLDFIENPKDRVVVLRHDVDKLPGNSLDFAMIQNQMGIVGSYYFRIVRKSFDENIIKKISELGHEIGYHYETMDSSKGNIDKAYTEFCENLNTFRKLTPIQTICMHGSPTSKFDNRSIWERYDYRDLNLKGEPYFDVNFDEVYYLTDTGRRFDGHKVSIRDKVGIDATTQWPTYHSSRDIICAIRTDDFPEKLMITLHPQRWTNNVFLWTREFLAQNFKNVIKRLLLAKNKKKNLQSLLKTV
ncbi:MAG: hypothetical protein WCL06_11990 [Bacteroidota bacterium]